jgi:hypothetical protein
MRLRGTIVAFLFLSLLFTSSANSQVGRGKFGFGISAAGNMLKGDWKTTDPGYGVTTDVSYSLGRNWGLLGTLGFDTYGGITSLNQNVLSTSFQGKLAITYDFLRNKPIDPFLFAGGGLVFSYPRLDNGASLISGKNQPWDFSGNGGLGFDIYVNESWSFMILGEVVLTRNDLIDGVDAGAYYDALTRVSIGVRYYLFDRSTVEEIVKTVEKTLRGE